MNAPQMNAIDKAIVTVEGVRTIISLYEHSRNCDIVSDEGLTAMFSMIDRELGTVSELLMAISLEADHE